MTYQWHIFLASLDPTRGSEQAGLGVVLVAGWGDGSCTVEADTFVDENGFTIIREISIRFTE